MFDIAWTEMLVVAALLIVVVGPKDLPKVLRSIGGWVRKARGMAREFQSSIEDLAREADVEDLKSQVTGDFPPNPKQAFKHMLDPEGILSKPEIKPDTPAPKKET